MKVIRESTHVSGFFYEEPLSRLPALTHCGEALTARGHQVAEHAHDGFEFHYLSHGQYKWRAEAEHFPQRMGDVLVNYPRELHQSDSASCPPSHFLWLGLKLWQLGTPGRRLARRLRGGNLRVLSGCHQVEPILRGLVWQLSSKRARRTATSLSYIHTFIALLEQRIVSQSLNAVDDAIFLPYSHGVQQAVAFLERNLDRRVSLDELAAIATMRHVPQFCRQFRREVGTTPAAYHRRLRLAAARQALQQRAQSTTLAAHQYGFSSSQHLSALFRREFGVSPGQWRSGSGGSA